MLIQLIVAGIVTGAIYALVAVGLVVIYKASNVLNFAHGYISGIAAFVSLTLLTEHAWPVWGALPFSVGMSVALGLLTEALVVRPLRHERPLTVIIATLGVALILSGAISARWGPSAKLYPPFVNGSAFVVSGLAISMAQVVMVAVTVVVVGLVTAFFRFTRTGVALRAASENPTIAMLLGINLRVVSVCSWGLGGFLGGLSAVLVAPQVSLTPDAINGIMIQSFAAVVLAGFTNIPGAVAGGLITGIALNLFAGYVVSNMPNTFLLVLLLAVLMLRPHGLFGRSEGVRI